jgi:hypothetical protein
MNRMSLCKRLLALSVAAAALGTTRVARADDRPPQTTVVERAPSYALWMGTRFGVFIPYGALYTDGRFVTTPFDDVATAGPTVQFDVGARFVRHFVGYALLDLASLGRGSSPAWTLPHGGQETPSTQALGIGLRWESNPEGLGVVADVAVAHRWFTARWSDGTTLRMNGSADVRAGLGASWRVTQHLTLAPMMSVFSGVFSRRTLDGQPLGESAGSYSALALLLSGHFDVWPL